MDRKAIRNQMLKNLRNEAKKSRVQAQKRPRTVTLYN